ncbi:MAG: 2'-5' RNA ligase family protein, partial [Phenylobacterium sp.]
GRPVGAESLHIPLNLVGEFDTHPDVAISLATEAASKVFMRPFTVALDRLATWQGPPGQRPLVLCGDEGAVGVDRLYDAIQRALADVGLSAGEKPETVAHMTIARGVAQQAEEDISPIRWRVREFDLVLTPPGDPRHVLQRWALDD